MEAEKFCRQGRRLVENRKELVKGDLISKNATCLYKLKKISKLFHATKSNLQKLILSVTQSYIQ